jgi:hypothetical protein
VADRTPLKSGVRIPEINQKLSHAPGIKLICGPGPKVKKIFTSIELTILKWYLLNGPSEIFKI